MYINTPTGIYPVSERDIRSAFPNTSFPNPFVPPDEFAWVFPTPQPTHDPIVQAVREINPVLTAKDHYEQQWEVVPRFTEYTDDEGITHTVAEQEAAAIEADRKSKVPTVVTMRQARLALHAAGLLDSVTAAVNAATPDVQIEWEYATEIKRDWPTLVTLAAALGLTELQLDELFTLAATL